MHNVVKWPFYNIMHERLNMLNYSTILELTNGDIDMHVLRKALSYDANYLL